MHALATVPAKRRTLDLTDTAAEVGSWTARTAQELDPELPGDTLVRVGRVASAFIDNAQRHGAPPIEIEVSVGAVVTIEITDHGPGEPAARADGTGSLAEIGPLCSLWDTTEYDGQSKTVTAVLPILDPEPTRRAGRRR